MYWQDLADLRAAPGIGRQERRAEALARATVIDPGRGHGDHAGAGYDLPFSGQAIAHYEPMAARVERLGMGLEVGAALGLEGDGEHLAGGQAAEFVEVERRHLGRGSVGVVDYPEHGVLLPAGVTRRFEDDYSGGYAASIFGMLIHNIWS